MNCPICQREVPEKYQEKHHLVPKSKNGRITIKICCNCGDMLHDFFSNKALRDNFNTIESIVSNEKVQKWIKWIRKKPGFSVCMKRKKRK